MKLLNLNRSPKLTAAELADLRRVELAAQIEHARQVDQLRREQEASDRAARREAELEDARAERQRRQVRARIAARRHAALRRAAGTARTVGPLLLVNAATVGGQLAYVHDQTPPDWASPVRAAVAVGVAAAAESVALYVGWHAHDALLAGARTTAARLRRASYGIAGVMALVNYSHFADSPLEPTALAVILGVLSSLSPWLWGLHTRRAQHVQLLRDDLVDEPGAQFDPSRRRAFPFRSWAARRWSIDHHVRDPREAWEGYRAHRAAQRAAVPSGRLSAAWAALRGRTAAPAQVEPAHPAPAEPVSLDDPEIRRCAELRQQMATARDRIAAGAARVALADRALSQWADVSTGIWDLVDATDEPAHVRRPAPARTLAQREPVVSRPAPEPEPEPAQLAIPGVPVESAHEPPSPASEPRRVSGGPGSRSDAERLAQEYDRLTRVLRREPSGSELAAAAACSPATAKRWKAARRVADAAGQ